MRTPRTRARFALLIVTGMVLFFAGVVAGSATGTLLRGEPDDPLLIGQENAARGEVTTLTASTTSGSALGVLQRGAGTAVRGESIRGNGGIFVTRGEGRSGLLAQNLSSSRGTGAAVTASGNENTGLRAMSDGGVGIWARSPMLAIHATGDVSISGDLALGGTCTGCATAVLALNDSITPLRQGDAVTLTGVSEDSLGALVVTVAPAAAGDRILGIVDAAMRLQSRQIDSISPVSFYSATGSEAAPNTMLRVITGGVVSFARMDGISGLAVGNSLVASTAPGSLAAATADGLDRHAIGYALGPSSGGVVAIFVAPHEVSGSAADGDQ